MSNKIGTTEASAIYIGTSTQPRLPVEYQEVEYIQSSGTQYITTNIVPSNTRGIYMKLSSQDISSDLLFIGSKKTGDTRFWIGNSPNASGALYLGWNTNDRGVISANTVFEAKLNYLNDRKKQVDNTVVASNIGTLSSNNNVPIAIFAGNENGTIITPSKIKLYSCQITDNSDIINDFIPCYRKADTVIGLYDVINDVFYTNSGSGTFTKGNNVIYGIKEVKKITIRPNTPRLPTAYQEVEYIESSGTQFIDTSYLITPNTEVSIDYQYTNANNQDFAFGVGSDTDTSSGMTFCLYVGTTGQVPYFKAGLSDGTGSSTFTNNGPGTDTNRHKFVLNNGHFLTYNSSGILQQDVTTSATFTRTAEHSFGLFCWWRTDTSSWSNKTSAKLYGCEVKNNGVLQRNFIPCYRKADNVIGLYDLVNDTFYTNSGTGTFAKGADTSSQVEKQIRPIKGLPYDNVYITTSGIYTGTDASPLTTQIKAATIYGAFYDREQSVIWLYTNNGVGWYDFGTDTITIVDNYAQSSIGGAMAFYGDYIVVQCGTSYIAVMDRATKTKTRTINIPSGNYSSATLNSPYDQTCKYVILGQGCADKYVYDITTGTQGSNWGSSYFQVKCFNDKVIKTCENSDFSGINISDAPNGANSVTVSSGTYTNHSSVQTDSRLVSNVTSADMEYDVYCAGCSRNTTNTQLINVSTKTNTTWSTGNKSVCGLLYKYNSQYAIAFGHGNYNGSTDRLWKIDKSNNNALTEITTGNNGHINILSSGNIAVGKKGIVSLDGTIVYSNSDFITAFSRNVYNG